MSSNDVSAETSTETRASSSWTPVVALSSLSSQPAKRTPASAR